MKKEITIKASLLFIGVLVLLQTSNAQLSGHVSNLHEIVLKIDTTSYSLLKNRIHYQSDSYLYFKHDEDVEICELNIYPHSFENIAAIKLMRSADFEIFDSLINVNNQYFKVKIKFNNLFQARFLDFTFIIQEKNPLVEYSHIVKLFPYTDTPVTLFTGDDELFIGEEKIFNLLSNAPKNIKIENNWTQGEPIDYRFSEKDGQVRLHVLPNKLGTHTLNVKLQTIRPFLNARKEPSFHLPVILKTFSIRNSRLAFLNVDKRDVTLDEESQRGIEFQIDNHRNLAIGKTYRIENNEAPGNLPIGEIFTRSRLSNDKILCWLRVFNYHKNSDGYLYIKDGDNAVFITNFSVTPKTVIQKVSLLRDGSDWTDNLSVTPGEHVEIKFEGTGMYKARFQFEDLTEVIPDSSIVTENISVFKVKVPISYSKKRINIYNNQQNTGFALLIREFQVPRPLDFITVSYADNAIPVTKFNEPVLYDKTIKDVIVDFRPEMIDAEKKLFGKQFLTLEIRLFNSKKELVEIQKVENIIICPDENSPRYLFYNDKNCNKSEISINRYISRKTYDLDDWSKIELIISHDQTKYGETGFSHKAEIIVQKHVRFDIDVSFPAGLLVTKLGVAEDQKLNNLSGISTAVIAQFSFFQPDKINRLQPYRFGMGFIALNAFNFNENNSGRDVGIVALGALFPTKRDMKLSFPLYGGFGYLLKENKWFFILGPGIQVRF